MKDCPCVGGNLDKFIQPAVLAVLSEGPLHGYRILQHLGAIPMFESCPPDTAGVYRVLKAMQGRGLVTSAWDVSASGPAKRRFDLTAAGRQCLGLWAQTLADYHRRIGRMIRLLRTRSACGGAVSLCRCHKKPRTIGRRRAATPTE